METLYSVYARSNDQGIVTHLFSDFFEKPKEGDSLIKSGNGEEFVQIAEGGGKSIYLR